LLDPIGGNFLDHQRNVALIGGAGAGTGKTHLAIAIARACIRDGRRGRSFNVADLVNRLEAEALAAKGATPSKVSGERLVSTPPNCRLRANA
jgi:DNA replication protein DnaC